jgi:hypothetical protein
MQLSVPTLPEVIIRKSVSTPEEKAQIIDVSPVENIKAPQLNSKIIILHTKEITPDDLEMIRRHGKVITFSKALLNLNLLTIDADYILCNALDEDILRSLEKHFNNDQDNLSFCVYCRFYEKVNFSNMNCFSTFKDSATKEDFDFLLLNEKNFKKISPVRSCLSYLVNLISDLKR